MKRAVIAALLAACSLGVAACGDDSSSGQQDGGPKMDAAPDGPPGQATLTTYVIDLVKNQTMDTTAPKAFSEFSSLPDPDGDMNNLTAYQPLFQ